MTGSIRLFLLFYRFYFILEILYFKIVISHYNPPICQKDDDCLESNCDFYSQNQSFSPYYYFCKQPKCKNPSLQSFNGICNNLNHGNHFYGSVNSLFNRIQPENSQLSNTNPRLISDAFCAQKIQIPNNYGHSMLLIGFGQFIHHDISLILQSENKIEIPGSRPVCSVEFSFSESFHHNPTLFKNKVTSFFDLSQIYGSSEDTANSLRKKIGGELKSQWINKQEYLPFNTDLEHPCPFEAGDNPFLFASGDARINENIILTAFHTLFLREHNRIARVFMKTNHLNVYNTNNDESAFQYARRVNIAQYQNIIYNEFFPSIFGFKLTSYSGYNDEVSPDLFLFFSTIILPFWQSGMSDELLRINEFGEEDSSSFTEAYFAPRNLIENGGVDSILLGLSSKCHERLDSKIVDPLRNDLFLDIKNNKGNDICAINILRGRTHKLSYTLAREHAGLSVPKSFLELTGNITCLANKLSELYPNGVIECDAFICGLLEPAFKYSQLGPLFTRISTDQFLKLRDSDRFYFENTDLNGPGFSDIQVDLIRKTNFKDILERNTKIRWEKGERSFSTPQCCIHPENGEFLCVLSKGSKKYKFIGPIGICQVEILVNNGAFYPGTKNKNGKITLDCRCNRIW